MMKKFLSAEKYYSYFLTKRKKHTREPKNQQTFLFLVKQKWLVVFF